MGASAFPKAGSTPSKTPYSAKKASMKRNTSILSFFQKTDGPPKATSTQSRITQFGLKIPRTAKNGSGTRSNSGKTPGVRREDSASGADAGSLFIDDTKRRAVGIESNRDNEEVELIGERPTTPDDDLWGDVENEASDVQKDDERFNENETAIKRRKIQVSSSLGEESKEDTALNRTVVSSKAKKSNGPFIDESDSEDDLDAFREVVDPPADSKPDNNPEPDATVTNIPTTMNDESSNAPPPASEPPPLVREATSHIEDDEFADFDDIEEDEFQGEDFLEGQWMEEQKDLGGYDTPETSGAGETNEDANDEIPSCPICQASLSGLSDNVCLSHLFRAWMLPTNVYAGGICAC